MPRFAPAAQRRPPSPHDAAVLRARPRHSSPRHILHLGLGLEHISIAPASAFPPQPGQAPTRRVWPACSVNVVPELVLASPLIAGLLPACFDF